ncbi:DSBA-like thioredoxin domain protein [Roseovarius albus]|uniref:2-hydroxychromene-2-carboxylate isomerase n=1 Tax=Roseovarius albus TaxID=1247867 RepID=A0A1X7A342_9RHOB|nr:DsbA family protein [Roseovarius albus]SLN67356.1 DSBA-like thioredoxin domain protein [Roseovarius albus]
MVRVEVFYSLQSDYCYLLLDRLIGLAHKSVQVDIVPVLGGVLRLPHRYLDRDELEQQYFATDTKRLAEFLGLPHAYPDPSPIDFKPGSLWIAEENQPRNEYLCRLYIGATRAGRAMAFLDVVGRMLWDGSTPGWDQGDHLSRAMAKIGLNLAEVLEGTSWESAKEELDRNAEAMLAAGHWGVPLMVYDGEPFYGQDRFDHLIWRMRQKEDLQ